MEDVDESKFWNLFSERKIFPGKDQEPENHFLGHVVVKRRPEKLRKSVDGEEMLENFR